MSFLLRTDDSYRLCYGEPKRPFIKTKSGSYFCAIEHEKIMNEENEISAYEAMEDDHWPIDSWADVSQNDLGIEVSVDVAEYLLQGNSIDIDEFIELKAVKTS